MEPSETGGGVVLLRPQVVLRACRGPPRLRGSCGELRPADPDEDDPKPAALGGGKAPAERANPIGLRDMVVHPFATCVYPNYYLVPLRLS